MLSTYQICSFFYEWQVFLTMLLFSLYISYINIVHELTSFVHVNTIICAHIVTMLWCNVIIQSVDQSSFCCTCRLPEFLLITMQIFSYNILYFISWRSSILYYYDNMDYYIIVMSTFVVVISFQKCLSYKSQYVLISMMCINT